VIVSFLYFSLNNKDAFRRIKFLVLKSECENCVSFVLKSQKPLSLNGVNSDRNRELLSVEKQENLVQSYDSTPTVNNTLINFSLFLVIITVVGLFLMFYGYSMKRERMKAHII
jgi:hypothetical protein